MMINNNYPMILCDRGMKANACQYMDKKPDKEGKLLGEISD